MSAAAALFGVIPIGQAMLTTPTSVVSETSLLYAVTNCNAVTVCLIPGAALPPQTAAAIYAVRASDFAAASGGSAPDFQFAGAVGPGQESVSIDVAPYMSAGAGAGPAAADGAVLGISIEPAAEVAQKLQQMPLVRPKASRETTIALAQNIISNAFDFIASFSGSAGPGGVEVVPLKAFENWWKKFESRVRSDPSFLERQSQ
ncbi:uncharacterized protein BROUX77_005595 [Berkeleyomyces rouxiae]|uniref:uncharacterized protein n=1 Tax=Berkeleyomyces rouxiae TaxID=2035830 RepID=UPI003B77DFF6